jgi:RNA recognition motif-containing protein
MVSMDYKVDTEVEPRDGPTDEEKRTLWVGNLSEKVDEEMLYELFINVCIEAGNV